MPRTDEVEELHEEMNKSLQVDPMSEEEFDDAEEELGEGFEHAASAEELRHGLGGHHEETGPERSQGSTARRR
ncbi:MAG: hypothetical protein WBV82_16995 [Myxococcaceae bacterium]